VRPPEFAEVTDATVDKVDGVEYGGFVITMELELREVRVPKFAEVVIGELEVGAVG